MASVVFNAALLAIMGTEKELRGLDFYIIWLQTILDLIFTGTVSVFYYVNFAIANLANACFSYFDLWSQQKFARYYFYIVSMLLVTF